VSYFASVQYQFSWVLLYLQSSCASLFHNGNWDCTCETGSCAVPESNKRNRNGFGQHFTENNRNEVDRTDDRLWKLQDLFEIIRTNFSKFYNPSKHLAIDEVIVKFKGRVVFMQYITKKDKRFGIKMFKLRDSTGYTYGMNVYLGKDKGRNNTWQQHTLQWLIWQGR